MSDSVQFKGASDWVYVSASNPLPITTATPSGTPPTTWGETDISATSPLPVKTF